MWGPEVEVWGILFFLQTSSPWHDVHEDALLHGPGFRRSIPLQEKASSRQGLKMSTLTPNGFRALGFWA